MIVAIQMMAVVALILGIYFVIKRDTAKLGHFGGNIALWMMLLFAVLAGLFIAGETQMDPGEGNNAYVLIAAWSIPLVVLTALAWKAPRVAKPILFIFFALSVVANVAALFFPDKYNEFFNTEGPWLGIGSFVFTVAVTVWGYHNNKLRAGFMAMTIALLPMLEVLRMGEPRALFGMGSSAALLTPGFIAGVLLVLSDRLDHEIVG